MDDRIDRLEGDVRELRSDVRDIRERLVKIETRLDTFNETFATKADMHREFGAQTWKIIGAMGVLAGVVLAITRFLG